MRAATARDTRPAMAQTQLQPRRWRAAAWWPHVAVCSSWQCVGLRWVPSPCCANTGRLAVRAIRPTASAYFYGITATLPCTVVGVRDLLQLTECWHEITRISVASIMYNDTARLRHCTALTVLLRVGMKDCLGTQF